MSDERRELVKALAVASYDPYRGVFSWIENATTVADCLLAALDKESPRAFERGWTDPAMQSPPTKLTDRDKEAVQAVMDALWKEKTITQLVDKFLAWPLPKTLCADLCVTDSDYKFPRYGTSLLNANEAKQLMEYLFDKESPPTPGGEPQERTCQWKAHGELKSAFISDCGMAAFYRASHCQFCGGRIVEAQS